MTGNNQLQANQYQVKPLPLNYTGATCVGGCAQLAGSPARAPPGERAINDLDFRNLPTYMMALEESDYCSRGASRLSCRGDVLASPHPSQPGAAPSAPS